MQTSKPRNGTSEPPNKKSPVSPKPPRASRMSGSDSDSAASKLTAKKKNERSPSSSDRRSPKHPVIVVYEKKRSVKLSELESQLTQLQEELKKTKDMLSSSESSKQCVQEEAEEDSKQLTIMSAKLEESHLHLVELSKAEDTRFQELRKISQERDKAWQSELEALQKQHTVDSTALVCAVNEIQMLKQQLDQVMKSKITPSEDSNATHIELEALKDDMAAVLQTVQNLSVQIREKELVEEEAKLVVSQTQKQLEMANATIGILRAEGSNLLESLNSTRCKLEESRARVSALEEVVKQLQVDVEDEEVEKQKPSYPTESGSTHSELAELRDALEAVEFKYLEEHIRATMEIQSAYEMAELVKLNAEKRELELESALQSKMAENSNFNIRLLDMETAFQTISEANKELKEKMEMQQAYKFESELKLLKATTDMTDLKANLLDRETELQGIVEENDILKSELSQRDIEHQKNLALSISDAQKAKIAEEKALKRVDSVNEEAEKNDKRLTKVMEQLQVAQVLNSEMEAELRCLRVQSDQWRKAAEAAAAILSPASNGRVVERIGSMDSDYNSLSCKLMSSPFSDDLYDESPKKKNGNVLRKFGGLWKKGTK